MTLNPKDKFDPFPTSIAIKGVQSELDDKENSKAKLHSTFSKTLIIINELDHIPASILDLISIVSFLLVFLGTKISKKMKELGFSFCGPVTVYSFMQASGIVNDHLVSCPHYLKCQKD